MMQQITEVKSNIDDVKSNTIDFTQYNPKYCTVIDIHNILLFSWQRLFIDIRTEKDYKESHIKEFVNIPLNSDEKIVLDTLQNALTVMEEYSYMAECMTVDIYVYSNKNMIENKLDDKWYQYIHKILCKQFASNDNTNKKGYEFGNFYILKTNYQIFANKYSNLIGTNDTIDPYPSIIIENKLLLGDADDAHDKEIIIKYGITHILNMTNEVSNGFMDNKDLNIKYLRVELSDSPSVNIANKFDECIAFMDTALNKKDNTVLVHCFAGVSRSSTIIIAYLMKTQNMTLNNALQFVKQKRRIIEPNAGFLKQLKSWQDAGYKCIDNSAYLTT